MGARGRPVRPGQVRGGAVEQEAAPTSMAPAPTVIGPNADSIRNLQGDYSYPAHVEITFGPIVEPGQKHRPLRPEIDQQTVPANVVFRPFDGHRLDPLSSLGLTEKGFYDLTSLAIALADTHAGGRLVSTLEGGYDLDGLAASVTAHVGALADIPFQEIS